MKVFEPDEMLDFKHLPAFAGFLLDKHLDSYTADLLQISFQTQLPLLKHITHLSDEQLFLFSRETNRQFLSHLKNNNARAHIEASLRKWMEDRLEIVAGSCIETKDITLINYVRGKVLKKWITAYTSEVDKILAINDEIDALILSYNTSSLDTYIQMLKNRVEEELHFSKNLVNALPGITYIFDLVGQKEIYISGKVEEIMGTSVEEVLRMGNELIAKLTHPDDLPIVAQLLQNAMQDTEGKTYVAEYRFLNKEGHYRWLRSYVVVYKRNDKGEPVQILGTAYEVNNEKEFEAALLKREQQLLEAQAIGHIGSFEWDIINDVSVSTPELRKIFEADRRQNLEEIMLHVHPDDQEKLRKALDESFVTGVYECEYRYLAKSGEKVIDSRGIVSFADGKPAVMKGTIQDVTERKKIEKDLQQKTIELKRSNEQLQEFAYVASHDMKEPLRKISMYSDRIITSDWDSLPESTRSSLEKIAGAVKRMQELIDGILNYSSISSNVQKARCDLETILKETLISLEHRIKEQGAIITYDPLPCAEVIPLQIGQLFQNLIGNALKFSKKGEKPVINISNQTISRGELPVTPLQSAAKYLQIEVTDNGIGFNEEASEKIFQLFQRLHGKSDYEGSGLGLAICKRIIEIHGGAITARSQPGIGSVFTIVLPL